MASSMTPRWRAPSGCPDHLRLTLERHVNALPIEYLSAPITDKVFEILNEAHRRLTAYALV